MAYTNQSQAILPFFEIDSYPGEKSPGRIRACVDDAKPMETLDFFCCNSDRWRNLPESRDRDGIQTHSVETALQYIAACIADGLGKDVVYCRHERQAARKDGDLPAEEVAWRVMAVRPLLEHYESVARCR